MVVDCVTFNGETELFEIRYNVLKDYVDEFRVIEFDYTFSGKPKHPLFAQNWPKVKSYYVTEATWSKYRELALSSPNTEYGGGASHWITEFCQKESIKDCLNDLREEDIIFVGDVDEIWRPELAKCEFLKPFKLRLQVYSYYLNNLSNEEFYGTLVGQYKDIKDKCLNELRSKKSIEPYYQGWHFTSIGGYEKVKQKLTDSYTEESYANQYILANLYDNVSNSHDFLGRNFTYTRSEEEWPQYLKDNRSKYIHLLRP